jgi:hypothetical protein
MMYIDGQVAAQRHHDQLDAAHHARLVRALRAQRRAGRLSDRANAALRRASATTTHVAD